MNAPVAQTRAVLSTSIALPVSERLSQGLALSGPTITYTTLSDIGLFSLLGVLVGDRVGAIRVSRIVPS